MANVTLTDEVRDVLNRSTIEGNNLRLPVQLERKAYEAVNKALVAAGGKWNTKAKAHVFPGDPRQKLGLMLEMGVAIDEKKLLQAFFTPNELAAHLAVLGKVAGKVVLEPSAGRGAIADACMTAGAISVRCVEINPESVEALCQKGYKTTSGDFLKLTPEPYERIVMNPPFTRNQDVAHVRHALKFLAPNGLLVSVMYGNKNRESFQALLDDYACDVFDVPAGTFRESGTDIATVIVTIAK